MTSSTPSESEDHLIRIDPKKEVPFSRYQELKGLSQSRVSQLKAEGKLQIRFIPFLNQELVVLSPEDYQLNQLLPPARQPTPSLSYRQLGSYFTAMLLEYETQLSMAERLSRQHQERAEQLAGQLLLSRQQLDDLKAQHEQILDEKEAFSLKVEALGQDNSQLTSQQEQLRSQLAECHQQREAWQDERKQIQEQILMLQTRQQVAEPFQTQLSELSRQVSALTQQMAAFPATPAPDYAAKSTKGKTSRKEGPTS